MRSLPVLLLGYLSANKAQMEKTAGRKIQQENAKNL